MAKGPSYRQAFLEGLADRVEKFKALCATSVCDDEFPKALKDIQGQGKSLIYGFQNLIDHAAELEARLNANLPKKECGCPIGDTCACHTP